MRKAFATTLLLGAGALLQGCSCFGAVSRFDGEWPVASLADPGEHWDEVVAGEGGTILRRRGSSTKLMVVTPGGRREVALEKPLDLSGAWITRGAGGRSPPSIQEAELYRIGPEGVVKARLHDPAGGETVARVESARAVCAAGESLLVARPGSVVLVRGASARSVWRGEALAIALDARRSAAWIASREPLAVVDLVGLEDGEVRCRIPLPEALDSANLRVSLSGGQALIWAHDRPLEEALLVAPELGAAWRVADVLRATDAKPARFEADSSPPLLEPASPVPPERAQRVEGPAPDSTFGRVAPSPGGRFVLATVNANHFQAQVVAITSATTAEHPPSCTYIRPTERWSGLIQGVTWTDEEVVIATDEDRLLRVKQGASYELDAPFDLGRSLRHGFNYAFNVPILALEAGISIPCGVAAGCLVVPFAPPLFLVKPEVGLLALVAPLWFPFVRM